MAKRSEVFKALKANGWKYTASVKGTMFLEKGTSCVNLYLDGIDLGMVPDFGGNQRIWIGYDYSHIRVEGTKLFLPAAEATGPCCG